MHTLFAIDHRTEAGLFTLERDTDATSRLQKVLTGQLDAAIIGHGTAGLEHVVQGNPRLVNRRDELSVLPKPLARDPLYLATTKTMKKSFT